MTTTESSAALVARAELVREFRGLSSSLWVSQTLFTAAELGLADLIGDGSHRAGTLAEAVGADPLALGRLLRAMVTLGLLTRTDEATGTGEAEFALTPLGGLLRSAAQESVRNSVLLMAGPGSRRAWGELVNCVRTGATAAKLLDGLDDPFAVFATPEARAVFDGSMTEGTRRIAEAVVDAYDFAGIGRLVDVGGGYGALLAPILRANPGSTGTVFDLARCAAGARELGRRAGIAERCDFAAGDFFADPVPPGADAYLLKSVLHDWDDDRCLAILRNCRAAVPEGGRLLVIEVVVPERLGTSATDRAIVAADLNMLVSTGGRERTEAEYRDLLGRASFALTRIVPTLAGLSVIEAAPAEP